MSKRKTRTQSLLITERALRDIAEIEQLSIETWGKRVASRYIADIEAGIQRLADNPGLLREESGFHADLRFYRVNKHLLVCDVQVDAVFVLGLLYASMDIPERLIDLEPTLSSEVELLHRKLHHAKRDGR